MNRPVRILRMTAAIAALLALAGCTTVSVPTPWGTAHYRQVFQKKGLNIECDPITGRLKSLQYNTEVDPTVAAIAQAVERGIEIGKSAAK